MKPLHVRLYGILNVWTCFLLLPFAAPFMGGLSAGLGGLPTIYLHLGLWGRGQGQYCGFSSPVHHLSYNGQLGVYHSEIQAARNATNAITAT